MTMLVIPDDIDFAAYMKESDGERKIRDAADYLDDMIDEVGTPAAIPKGWDLPWDKMAGMFRFHPGEVTLWGGANGSGKSLITGMVALELICKLEKVCIASLEMKPKSTLNRMVRQWLGSDPLRDAHIPGCVSEIKAFLREFQTQARGRLFLYDQLGQVQSDVMLGVIRYAASIGIKHFFVDSLMKCVRGTDDYNAQKDFVNALTAIAKDTGMTIHLVAHTRKLSDEGKKPTKYDISGSGDITNLVDNALLFWRNKPKEADARAGIGKLTSEPDALLLCCKQRENGDEPEFALWYHHASKGYTAAPNSEPIYWADRLS